MKRAQLAQLRLNKIQQLLVCIKMDAMNLYLHHTTDSGQSLGLTSKGLSWCNSFSRASDWCV